MISGRTLVLVLIALNLLALAWWSGAMDPLIDDGREPGRIDAQIQPDRLELIGPVTADDGDRAAQTPSGLPGLAPAASQVNDAQQRVVVPSTEVLVESTAPVKPVADMSEPFAPIAGDAKDEETEHQVQPVDYGAMIPKAGPAPEIPDVPDIQFPDVAVAPAETGKTTTGFTDKQLPLVAAAIEQSPEDTLGAVVEKQSACVRYSGLSYVAIRRLEDDYLARGASIDMRRQDRGNYFVYIEPLPSQQLAERKEEQLRRLGVKDTHIIKIGPYRNAISLGLLRNYDLATSHMNQMSRLGVTTMRIGPVNATGSRYEISIRGPVALIEGEVRKHLTLRKRFGRDCD